MQHSMTRTIIIPQRVTLVAPDQEFFDELRQSMDIIQIGTDSIVNFHDLDLSAVDEIIDKQNEKSQQTE